MKIINTRLKKAFFIGFCSIIFLVLAVIILISPVAKYLIEKYDVAYTGRQIKTGWVYVNPFTGFVHISNLRIFELQRPDNSGENDTVFFSSKGLSVNFALFKILSHTFEITRFTLNQPRGTIIQNKSHFNFDDLINKFSSKTAGQNSSRVHFNILGIKIINGEFFYHEQVIPVKYFIKRVNVESKGKYWQADTIAVKFSLLSGTGSGKAEGNITVNLKSLDYRISAVIKRFDLKFMEQYLKDLVNYGSFSANVDANIKATGNLNDQENLNAEGLLAMNDFHFGEDEDNDYVSFKKFIVKIDTLSPEKHRYLFDSISLSSPYLKYERYEYLDNLQRMFGKKGAKISAAKADPARFNLILRIGDYIKVLSRNFFKSDYRINKLAIYNGKFNFRDFSLAEVFSTEANPFDVKADSVNSNHKRVDIAFKSVIRPYGNISVALSINPKDSGDYDMQYHFRSLPVTMFNPYLITYTSFPLDGGTVELNGAWKMRNGSLKSDNHLLVIDPQVAKRMKNKDTKWIPSPLIMSFIRERGNVIDYEIPITGNLKNPRFRLHDVIFDILGNIFVKPATIPYRAEVKYLEDKIDKSIALQWQMRQSEQHPDQEKFVNKMVDFLNHNPEASISVYPIQYEEKEKEYIGFFEAKKKYFLLSKDKNAQFLSEEDSLKVDKMSVMDSLFVHYLDKQLNDSMLFTVQGKCSKYIGSSFIDAKFKLLNEERERTFIFPFKKQNVENRVKIYPAENNIPYNGFSFYKIVYKGEFPESLLKAYHELNELNREAPRKRFLKEREKNNRLLQGMN